MELILVNSGIVAMILLVYVSGVFVVAQYFKDNSVMDIFYGPAFFVAAYLFLSITKTESVTAFVLLVLIAIWACRLSSRIFIKNIGKPEDPRYAAWRRAWMERGRLYFILRSFLQINLLQGFVILLILTPFIISVSSPHELYVRPLVIGALITLFGIAYESIADWQLDRFLKRKKAGVETKNLMTEGLFKYSRRPNYFGECLVWLGQAVIVLPLPYGWLGLISPLVITYVVTKITGPILEQQFLKKYPEEYQTYMDTTSYLIPLPPKHK